MGKPGPAQAAGGAELALHSQRNNGSLRLMRFLDVIFREDAHEA